MYFLGKRKLISDALGRHVAVGVYRGWIGFKKTKGHTCA
jgi:hypothetical protein